jgi:hypothetical protein
MQKLAGLVKTKQAKLIQIGNTVFLVKPVAPGIAEFHTFTVEPPESLVKRFQAGAKTLKQMGFKKAVSYAESPAFAKLAQSTGLPVKTTQALNPQTKKPVYRFELDL